MGYSRSELEDVQARWSLRFPPDLVDLLLECRTLIVDPIGSFDWVTTAPSVIQKMLDWPFDGFWFDVVTANVWWEEWGDRPPDQVDQRHRLKEIFDAAPKLIPLFGHRYLPEEPFERGNPVISVYQSDVIWYGANLEDWMAQERRETTEYTPPNKEVRFWSDAVRKNGSQYRNVDPKVVERARDAVRRALRRRPN